MHSSAEIGHLLHMPDHRAVILCLQLIAMCLASWIKLEHLWEERGRATLARNAGQPDVVIQVSTFYNALINVPFFDDVFALSLSCTIVPGCFISDSSMSWHISKLV